MKVLCLNNLHTRRKVKIDGVTHTRNALEVGQAYRVEKIGRGVRAKMYLIAGIGWFEARRFM